MNLDYVIACDLMHHCYQIKVENRIYVLVSQVYSNFIKYC
jgi:hypothetical protein